MSDSADRASVMSFNRPLASTGPSLREDLIRIAMQMGHRRYHILKDPLNNQVYYFDEREHFVMQNLGDTSLEEIPQTFAQRFPHDHLEKETLHRFVAKLRDDGLLRESRSGMVREKQSIFGGWSLFSVKLPGFNPQRILSAVAPPLAWLFHPLAVMSMIGLVSGAGLLLLTSIDSFFQSLMALRAWMQPQHLMLVLLSLAGAKVIHECAHALACHHFGGQCTRCGILLLMFVPCLYCDISDMWMQPSRWKRIVVSAAGIMAECLLAAIATLVWSVTSEGPLQLICVTLMIACTLNTVLINGNPLLRYDGYYVLIDLLQMPNLGSESQQLIREKVRRFGHAQKENDSSWSSGERSLLWSYGILSGLYRISMILLIAYGIDRWLGSIELPQIGRGLAILLIATTFWIWTKGVRRDLSQMWRQGGSRKRMVVGWIFISGLLGAFLFIPWPHSISAVYMSEPEVDQHVFAREAGRIVAMKPKGTLVCDEEVIGELENPGIRSDLARRRLEVESLKSRIEHLQKSRSEALEFTAQLPALRSQLTASLSQLALIEARHNSLILSAPFSGRVQTPVRECLDSEPGKNWIDPQNLGSFVEKGDCVCRVTHTDRSRWFLWVAQQDIDLIRPGDQVVLHRPGLKGNRCWGTIEKVDQTVTRDLPRLLALSQLIPADPKTPLRSRQPLYRVSLNVNSTESCTLPSGLTGTACVETEPTSLWTKITRAIR